jgi:hypothetical protein
LRPPSPTSPWHTAPPVACRSSSPSPTSPTKAVAVFCIADSRLEWQGKGHLVSVEAMSPCSASASRTASAPTSCPGEARRRTAPPSRPPPKPLSTCRPATISPA